MSLHTGWILGSITAAGNAVQGIVGDPDLKYLFPDRLLDDVKYPNATALTITTLANLTVN